MIERAGHAIEAAMLFYEVRIQRVERALARLAEEGRGYASAWEVWERLVPKADPVTEMRTRMYMVIGALDCLEDQRKVEVRWAPSGALEHRPR